MQITKHAQHRFSERFPDLDINEEIEFATRRLSRKELKAIKDKMTTSKHKSYLCSGSYNGIYFRKTSRGIVFVIDGDRQKVVTCFPSQSRFCLKN